MATEQATVLTIGHSTHSIETFTDLLKRHKVTAVADVRSAPYSRHQPQFNREKLQAALKSSGIAYVFLGAELGARSKDASNYEHGRVQYSRLAEMPEFRAGIARVAEGAKTFRIALMCAEKEPLDCHRTFLVAPALEKRGFSVTHIRSDGSLESHHDALLRLVDELGMPRSDMFHSEDELIQEAAKKQEAKIAYVDETLLRAGEASR